MRMKQTANASSVPLRRHSLSVVVQFASEGRLSPASALHFVSFEFESFHSETEATRSYGLASPEVAPFLPCQLCARKKARQATLIFPWNSYQLTPAILATLIITHTDIYHDSHRRR